MWILYVILLMLPGLSIAAPEATEETASAAVALEFGGEVFGGAAVRSVSDSALNPDNRIVREGSLEAGLDARPELRVSHGDTVSALFRPRIRPRTRRLDYPSTHESEWRADYRFYFDEASLRWDATPSLFWVAGVHYYSWGPGELMSPSNPLFHFQWDSRSILFRQRGKVLLRSTYTPSPSLSVSVLVEPVDNGEGAWQTSADFTPRGLIRTEAAFGDGSDAAALVLGRMERGAVFLGQSANLYLTDAISVYADARETLGRVAEGPVRTMGALSGFAPGEVNGGPLHALALVGMRHEGFFDSRIEYVFNSYGLTGADFDEMTALARSFPQAVSGFGRPGLELPQRHYLFLSLRTDRLGTGDSLRLAGRYLHSLVDHSGALLGAVEWALSDRWTLIAQSGLFHGAADDEFRHGADWELLVDLRCAL